MLRISCLPRGRKTENAGHVVAKETLLDRVWPGIFVEESTLAQNILTLRKALGKQPDGRDYIGTIPKRGYRFEAPVTQESMEAADAPSALGEPHPRPESFRHIYRVAAIIAVAAVSLGGTFALRHYSSVLSAPAPRARIRLAVVPFANLNKDPAQDYLSDGFTEEMITQLGQLNPESLSVVAQRPAPGIEPQAVGGRISSDFVLTGSVRQEGNRIRMAAQLIRVSDQTEIWAANYDRGLVNILSMESQVAHSIAQEISIKISPEKEAQLGTASVDPEAYQLYLMGRHFWNRRTPDGMRKAISYLQQAIAKDPNVAKIHAALADCYAVQFLYNSVPARDSIRLARMEANRALELDPDLPEAYAALAYANFYDWDFAEAEKQFKKSIQLDPRYATAHQWYGEFLRYMGRQDEAIEQSRLALESDPLSPIINVEAALPYYFKGDYAKAVEQLQRAIDIDPFFASAHGHLARVYDQQGEYEKALQECMAAIELGDAAWIETQRVITLAHMGRKAEAVRALEKMTQASLGHSAAVEVALGRNELAISHLQSAYLEHGPGIVGIKVEPQLRPLYNDPRFKQIVSGIGLPL